MTPEEARQLLDWSERYPARQHRYRLEGGQRQHWRCVSGCGFATEAESEGEARSHLIRFSASRSNPCQHAKVEPTGNYVPTHDFS